MGTIGASTIDSDIMMDVKFENRKLFPIESILKTLIYLCFLFFLICVYGYNMIHLHRNLLWILRMMNIEKILFFYFFVVGFITISILDEKIGV